MNSIVAIIAQICLLSDPNQAYQLKRDCIDFMVNCSVGPNGEITKKTVEACEKTLPKRGAHDK